MIERKCGCCGCDFVARRATRKYCSRECFRKSVKTDTQKRLSELPKITRQCARCGTDFQSTRKVANYCTKRCSSAAYRDRNRNALPPKPCIVCGAEFKPNRINQRHCQTNCARKTWKAGRVANGYCGRCFSTKLPTEHSSTWCIECHEKYGRIVQTRKERKEDQTAFVKERKANASFADMMRQMAAIKAKHKEMG